MAWVHVQAVRSGAESGQGIMKQQGTLGSQ